MSTRPAASIRRASAGTGTASTVPTAAIVSPRITTVPAGISGPLIGITRPPTKAVTVSEAAGLDPERVMELLAEGAVASRLSKTKLPKAFKRDFSAQFQLGLMEKDLRYFVSLAQELDCPVPVASVVRNQLHAARRAGLGSLDVSAVLLQLTGEKPAG